VVVAGDIKELNIQSEFNISVLLPDTINTGLCFIVLGILELKKTHA
jgi:hypothetical protein